MTEPLKGTFAFISLGCPKNTVDSERMLGKLAQDGFVFTPDPEGADVVIINTCGFIEPARQESLGVIREMLALKEAGQVGAVVVAGCLAERKGDALLDEVPGVDHIMGVFAREEIAAVLDRTLAHKVAQEQRSLFRPAPVKAFEDTARLRVTPRHYAYLKISEGCDRLCTFCAIPMMRGKHVTKAIEEVLREARELVGDGVRELIVVAQDSTYYGKDLYGRTRLAELLRELEGIDGLEWIRVLYAYPMYIDDELLNTFAASKKILPYLDMPLQHANDRVLRRMARRVDRKGTETVLAKMRATLPNLTLRTTFIVGFPGETEAEFADLCAFVQQQKFERVGVFPYSFEPGTPAARLDGHLADEVKEKRRDTLMLIQQEIALAWAAAQVGREVEVIVDGPDAEVPGHYQARTPADAPEIDCIVRLKGKNLNAGDLVRARITAADGYDLLGKALRVR